MSVSQLVIEMRESVRGTGLTLDGEICKKSMRQSLVGLINGAVKDHKNGTAQGDYDDRDEQITLFMEMYGLGDNT